MGILSLLGDEPVKEEIFGPCIHKGIATRWSDILINGMKEETKNDVMKRFDSPDILRLAQPPLINSEIKTACSDYVLKRDSNIIHSTLCAIAFLLRNKNSWRLSYLTGIANTLSTLLTTDAKYED